MADTTSTTDSSPIVYFHNTRDTFTQCGNGSNKPGLGHPEHNPNDNRCSDCALLCCPLAFMVDIICLPYVLWSSLHKYLTKM